MIYLFRSEEEYNKFKLSIQQIQFAALIGYKVESNKWRFIKNRVTGDTHNLEDYQVLELVNAAVRNNYAGLLG